MTPQQTLARGEPPTRLPASEAVPWLHVQALRELEVQAQAGLAPASLMEAAGLAAARLTMALVPHAARVKVLCGPGNNGGDGLVCARWLHGWGRQVQVVRVVAGRAYSGDAAIAWQRALTAGVPIQDGLATQSESTGEEPFAAAEGDQPDLLIDAVLGIGSSRAPEGEVAAAIHHLATVAQPVLALDLPSGLSADTGRVLGQEAVRARWTLSFIAPKPGLFTGEGRDHAGDVWLADLGLNEAVAQAGTGWLSPGRPPLPRWLTRRHTHHKGSFGDVVAVGGQRGMRGAAVLAASSALRAGAGRVYLALLAADGSASSSISLQAPELMHLAPPWPEDGSAWSNRTLVVGCGGGDAMARSLPSVLRHAPRLVVDADALNATAAHPELARALAARHDRGLISVLTPHPLEAARLLGISTTEVQADRLAAAKQLARQTQSIVVLKGSGSVVSDPSGSAWINTTGGPALATAGSGDVLAGWIAGTWSVAAAGDPHTMAPDATGQWHCALEVTRLAVCEHGAAAPGHLTSPLPASMLIERLHQGRTHAWHRGACRG